jgi:hypothetical protein
MKKDIDFPKVEDVALAVVREFNEINQEEWSVYLVNLQDKYLDNVLVASRGYGEDRATGEKINTSVLRHFFEQIPPKSANKIELIMRDVFALNNEYWVSFYIGMKVFDKKYIFLPETISEDNFTKVPVLNKKGVMIR